jgi:hypothetical protein
MHPAESEEEAGISPGIAGKDVWTSRGFRRAPCTHGADGARVWRPSRPLTLLGCWPQSLGWCRSRATGCCGASNGTRSASPHEHDDGHDYHNEHYCPEAYVHARFPFLVNIGSARQVVPTGMRRDSLAARLRSLLPATAESNCEIQSEWLHALDGE